jgi:hypothetical protein
MALLLALCVFLTHFRRFQEFGLYEDDYWSIAAHLGQSFQGLWGVAKFQFQHWEQGRPLNQLLPDILGRLGGRAGGLNVLYLIAALWLSINSLLVYCVARRVLPRAPSLITAIAYVLYPADTTKILLIHVAHVQGAMTFLLIGLLLWTRGSWYRRAAYLAAAASLLSYESAYLPFLCAPLLLQSLGELRRRRACLEHLILCTATIGAVAWVRLKVGESRATEALGNLGPTLYRSSTSLILGPLTGLAAFFRSLFLGYKNMHAGSLILALALFAVLIYIMRSPLFAAEPVSRYEAIWTGRAALITWPVAYALTLLNYPPTQLAGRLTSTHVAAAWPVALLAGSISALIMSAKRPSARISLPVAGILFMGLFLYHQFIQAEYARAWSIQKEFWTQVIALTPDVNAGSSVIVQGSLDPKPSDVILSNSWADEEAYRRILGFAPGEPAPYFAVVASSTLFRKRGGRIEWQPEHWNGPLFVPIDPNDLILIESRNGLLRRVNAMEVSAGTIRSTRPIPPETGKWPHTIVSGLMQR